MKNRLVAAAVLLAAGAASAQKQQPGLWEITMQMKSASGQVEAAQAQMREQLKTMPPDQRKMMEEMMAKQGVGIHIGSGAPAVRICVTKEQADRGEIPQDPNGNCRHDVSNRSATGMRFSFACTNPPSKGSGEVVFSGDKAYTMKMQTETTAQGRPERIEMQHVGRWVGADCGALKR